MFPPGYGGDLFVLMRIPCQSQIRDVGPPTRTPVSRKRHNVPSGSTRQPLGGQRGRTFCILARLTYRQLCGLVQRPSETGAVIPHTVRCWSGTTPIPAVFYDPALFREKSCQGLGTIKVCAIAEATGCSKTLASDIRYGKRTPHVSAWGTLAGSWSLQDLGKRRCDD